MSLGQAYLEDVLLSFRKQKQLAENAFQQVVADEDLFRKPGEFSNSIAAIIKHVTGNLRSRWTDFLTSDGEKPSRDRDGEFLTTEADTRAHLIAAWEVGWQVLLGTLGRLKEEDLQKEVTIRGEAHSVLQAIHRALTHTAYHTGQIVYLSRLFQKDGWQWLTIPPGQSRQYNASLAARGKNYFGAR
jgi:uncharacterized damage-inducible protein DinB